LSDAENETEIEYDNDPPNCSGSWVKFVIEFTLAADGPADKPDIQNRSHCFDPIRLVSKCKHSAETNRAGTER